MNINRRWYAGAIAGIGMLSFSCTARKDEPQVKEVKPKDAKPKDAKSEFAAIEQEFQVAQQQLTKKVQEIEDRTEKRKYANENFSKLVDPFVDRVLALEKQFPDAPESTQAQMWLIVNTQNRELRTKLVKGVKDKIAKVDVKDLSTILGNPIPAMGEIGVVAFDKVKGATRDPAVEKVVAWAAQTTMYGGPNGENETYNKAIEMLVDQYPQSQSFFALAGPLSTDDNPKWAAEQFRKLMEKNKDGDNRLIGQFGWASIMSSVDGKEKEALEMLESFVKEAKEKTKLASLLQTAGAKLVDMKLLNHPIQEITGEDLDGKEFKITDYKGKVVLLDFWGFW